MLAREPQLRLVPILIGQLPVLQDGPEYSELLLLLKCQLLHLQHQKLRQ
jgi:hypothetical protein